MTDVCRIGVNEERGGGVDAVRRATREHASHEERLPQLVDAHHLLRLRVAQDAIGSEREQRVAGVDVATGQHEGRVVLVHGQAAQPAHEAGLRALRRR